MEIKENVLESIIRTAFDYGEEWGVTYSTWFTPTAEQKENKVQRVLNELIQP